MPLEDGRRCLSLERRVDEPTRCVPSQDEANGPRAEAADTVEQDESAGVDVGLGYRPQSPPSLYRPARPERGGRRPSLVSQTPVREAGPRSLPEFSPAVAAELESCHNPLI